MKDSKYFLGLEINRDRENKALKLLQEGATLKLIEKLNIEQTGTTPMKINVKLIKEATPFQIMSWLKACYISPLLHDQISHALSEFYPDISPAQQLLKKANCSTKI